MTIYIPREFIMFILGFFSCFIVAYIYEKYIEHKAEGKKGDKEYGKLEEKKQNK